MNTRNLHPGDHVEVQVRGARRLFEAVIADRHARKGYVAIDPVPSWATWTEVRPRQIVRKLERQGA